MRTHFRRYSMTVNQLGEGEVCATDAEKEKNSTCVDEAAESLSVSEPFVSGSGRKVKFQSLSKKFVK